MMKHRLSIYKLLVRMRPGFALTIGIGLWTGLVSCASEYKPSTPQPPSRVEIPASPQSPLPQLSLEEKVGQFLILGFSGTKVTPALKAHLTRVRPGGLILFGRNIRSFAQVKKLNEDLQAHAKAINQPPYLIMVDQEGGSVTRIKVGNSLPSALALSKTKNPEFIRSYSKTMGELLNRLGINMNLAPVLDASDPKSNSFIGSRSFGKSFDMVADLGISFALGQWDSGVIPTAKHFPGHGSIIQDSHKVTPVKNVSLENLLSGEAKPFEAFAKLKFPTATMLGHVSYPLIDKSRYPAAFSKEIGEVLLRDTMNYQGLALTDDLEMAGAEMIGSMAQRTVQAVKAGNDMIMVAWSTDRQVKAHRALLEAVRNGTLSEERLNLSLNRILFAKAQVMERSLPYSREVLIQLQTRLIHLSKEVKKLSFQSALSERTETQPLTFSSGTIQVISSDSNFFKIFKKSFNGKCQHIQVTKKNISQVINRLNRNVPKDPFVFYVSGIGTARWLNRLSADAKMKAIVINTNQPGAIGNDQDFLKAVNINSQSPESGEWLANYLNPHLRKPAAFEEESGIPE